MKGASVGARGRNEVQDLSLSQVSANPKAYMTEMQSFKTDSSLGISNETLSEFTPLMYTERPNNELLKLASGKIELKWSALASAILKKGNWARLGQLAKSLNSLPEDVAEIFDKLETKSKIVMNNETRLQYYQDFTRSALGSTTLHSRDVELLIRRRNPEIEIGYSDLHTLMMNKLEQSAQTSKIRTENNEYFDFEHFAALMYDLHSYHQEMTRVQEQGWSVSLFFHQLPIDPDSGRKQSWDILCLSLLLYCSFSIPYSIAFDTNIKGTTDGKLNSFQIFDSFVDCVFMCDIALSFVTGWDRQGFVIRDFRAIAVNYLRTWFLPDLAGSFPFDMVISAAIATNEPSGTISSSNFLRSFKLVRMLKLVRAVKFMNKLNKIKQRDGMEAFGSLISLSTAIFFLIFVSHLLGCFFFYMTQYETEYNWLLHYE
jgi:hypothetical protein